METKLVMGTPNEKQKLALLDKHKFVCFGGARGGGKSFFVRYKAIMLCLKHPDIVVCIVRKSYPELIENHIKPLTKMLHCYDPNRSRRIATYNDGKKTISFDNGSQILFRYCDNANDIQRFQGLECHCLFIDEATFFDEETFKQLTAIVRGTDPDMPYRIYLTCNPNGKGLGWVKRLFIDRKFKPNERPEDYSFIQSLVYDNTALMESDPEYLHQLEALPTKIRDAWLNGSWDVYAGQVFEEWVDDPEHYIDGKYTHIIEPFDIPLNWKIMRVFDFGYSHPFAVCWLAFTEPNESGDSKCYVIAEYYGWNGEADEGAKLDPFEIAQNIKHIEEQHPLLKGRTITGVADPAIWDASRGESIARVMEKYPNFIFFSKGKNDRLSGLMQFHYRMRFDEEGECLFQIFNTCKNVIRTLPLLIYDEKKVEDVDTTQEDHLYDAIRYGLMEYLVAPRIKERMPNMAKDPINMKSDAYDKGLYKDRIEIIGD